MVMVLTASNIIEKLGKDMYGDVFSLERNSVKEAYRIVFDRLKDAHSGTFKKGLLITGGVGTGKTALMRIMQRMFKDANSRFKLVYAYELKDLSEVYTSEQIKEMYGFDFKGDLYIDDIGIAAEVNRYGNTINIISELIMERYDLFIEQGFRTHVSSNLLTAVSGTDEPTLKSVYGNRVFDRLKEMCELIILTGESQRK